MADASTDQARLRVEEARRRLDDDIATLSDRLPAAAVVAQAGAAGGTGLALLGIAAKQVQKRMSQRSEEKALTREAEIQARAIAAAIAAAGLHGQPSGATAPAAEPDRPRRSERPTVSVPVPPPGDDDEDGGTPWGLILLLAGLVAAVIALVAGRTDDEDLWTTPGA